MKYAELKEMTLDELLLDIRNRYIHKKIVAECKPLYDLANRLNEQEKEKGDE